MNKVKLILVSLLLTSGCTQSAKIAMLSDVKLGMQIFEVREIHNKDLVPIAFESRQGYDLVQYSGWFSYDGKGSSPYKLTFELYPPLTKIQCQYIIAKNNITDPNKQAEIRSIEGLRLSRLIQVVQDEAALQQEAIHRQNAAMMSQMQQFHSNQQQILWNQQRMQNQMQFNNIRRGW